MGSKFTLSNHLTLKDKPHPFVRLGDAYDDSHLPGADQGHEPLGSRRVWVRLSFLFFPLFSGAEKKEKVKTDTGRNDFRRVCLFKCVCMCVCVCVRERESE